MLNNLKHAMYWLVIGVLVSAGMRLGEWLIPAPEERLLVCMADELGTVEVCRSFDELRASSEARQK